MFQLVTCYAIKNTLYIISMCTTDLFVCVWIITCPTMGFLQAPQTPLATVWTPSLLRSDCRLPSMLSSLLAGLGGPVGEIFPCDWIYWRWRTKIISLYCSTAASTSAEKLMIFSHGSVVIFVVIVCNAIVGLGVTITVPLCSLSFPVFTFSILS